MSNSADRGWAAKAARLPLIAVLALVFASPVTGVAQERAFEPRVEEPEEFPDFPGREEAFYACVACHNFQLVARQNMSRERWNEILDIMTARHGMPELDGGDRERILDYLAKAFPEADEAERGWQNPFLKR